MMSTRFESPGFFGKEKLWLCPTVPWTHPSRSTAGCWVTPVRGLFLSVLMVAPEWAVALLGVQPLRREDYCLGLTKAFFKLGSTALLVRWGHIWTL